jgi:hypothetical protein
MYAHIAFYICALVTTTCITLTFAESSSRPRSTVAHPPDLVTQVSSDGAFTVPAHQADNHRNLQITDVVATPVSLTGFTVRGSLAV